MQPNETKLDAALNAGASNDANIASFRPRTYRAYVAKRAFDPLDPNYKGKAQTRSITPEAIIRDVVNDYIMNMDPVRLHALVDEDTEEYVRVYSEIMSDLKLNFQSENAARAGKHEKPFSIPTSLPPYAAAQIVLATGDVRVLQMESGYRLIVKRYYANRSTNYEKRWSGTWMVIDPDDDTNDVIRAFRLFCPAGKKAEKDIYMSKLYSRGQSVIAQRNDNLVFCRNGVWDYERKAFTAYDDPNYDTLYPVEISLTKLPVYHPLGPAPAGKIPDFDASGNIIEPVLSDRGSQHLPWHPEQLLQDPFDMTTDVGKASNKVLRQTMQFLIRKTNSEFGYYQSWINMGGRGRNCKGTIWEMMRRLVQKRFEPGDEDLGTMSDRIIDLSIDQLDSSDGKYALAQNILTAHAIVGRETDSGVTTYIENAATYKVLARHESMTFREIYKQSFTYEPNLVCIQQSQRVPRFREKDESIISHMLAVPFEKTFDTPLTYIKSDYVLRDVVASYWLYQLTVGMDKISEYDDWATETLKPYAQEALTASMNTFQFLDEALPGLPYEKMPVELLYDLYIRWCEIRGITGKSVISAKSFNDDLEQYTAVNPNAGVEFVPQRTTIPTVYCATAVDTAGNHTKDVLALRDFGWSKKLGKSDFVDINDNGCYRLNINAITFGGSKSRPKPFNRGYLHRTIDYSLMNYGVDIDGTETEEEVSA